MFSPQTEILWNDKVEENRIAFFKLFEKAGHNLKSLTLTTQQSLPAIKLIVTNCPNITHVELRYFEDISKRNVLEILSQLTKLRSIELMIENFVKIDPFVDLLTNCVKLRRIRISFQYSASDDEDLIIINNFNRFLALFEVT